MGIGWLGDLISRLFGGAGLAAEPVLIEFALLMPTTLHMRQSMPTKAYAELAMPTTLHATLNTPESR